MPPDEKRMQTSFPELVYPSLRDEPVKDAFNWLKGKRNDDGAEGLWRIHDNLYDFTDFIKHHPGGEFWLTVSKGTDITEAFESHHLSTKPTTIIKNYFIRKATTKRNSPFEFKENGFYKTLKRRVKGVMDGASSKDAEFKTTSKRIMDFLTVCMFAFAIISCRVSSQWETVLYASLSGLFVGWAVIAAHNFLHQKDNWRMYILNFSFMNTREFRVTHILSHHQYPNTLMDVEVAIFEPVFQWMPTKTKSILVRFGPIFYSIFVYTFFFVIIGSARFIMKIVNKKDSMVNKEDLLPFTMPLAMYIFGNNDLALTIQIWLGIVCMSSFMFSLIGVNAAHHHPDIFHDGDDPRENSDWGIHQLHAVMDRRDINSSLFTVLTHFGDHSYHHLFPTIDHSYFRYEPLKKIIDDTCREFSADIRITSQADLFIGSFQQLARTEGKTKNK